MVHSLSKLSAEQLAAIQAFEKKSGRRILAFTDYPVEYDMLSLEELAELQKQQQKQRNLKTLKNLPKNQLLSPSQQQRRLQPKNK